MLPVVEDSKTSRSRNIETDKDNIVKTLTLFSVLTTIVLQSSSRTFFIGLTPHLYQFRIYSLVEIGILIASNGVGNLICILLIKQYAIVKQRLRISYGVCAFLASVSCFLMAAPYFLSSDIFNQNTSSNANLTLKTQIDLNDEKVRNIFGIKNDSKQLPVFASHIGAQLLVGCVAFALTIAAEMSKDVISLPSSTLWNKLMFGMPIFGEALGYIMAASVTYGESAWIHIYTTLGCVFLLLSIPILVIQDTDLQTPDAEEQVVLNHWLSKEKSVSWMSLFSVRFCCVLAAATLSTYFLQTTAVLLPVLIHIFYCIPMFICVLIGGCAWIVCFNVAPLIGWHLVCSTTTYTSKAVLRFVVIAWCLVGILYLICMPFECSSYNTSDFIRRINQTEAIANVLAVEQKLLNHETCGKRAPVFCLLMFAALFAGNLLSRAFKCSASETKRNFGENTTYLYDRFQNTISNKRSHMIRIFIHAFGFILAPIVVMTVVNSQISERKFEHNLSSLQVRADACVTNPLWGFCIFMGAVVAIAVSLLLPFGFGCFSQWHSTND